MFMGGELVDNENICVLMYADDLVILATDRIVLQGMINPVEKYCEW